MTKESLLTEKMKLLNDSKIKITHLESELLESKVIKIQTQKMLGIISLIHVEIINKSQT